MNKTKIEWCDYTWNPVTGCLHNCEYCYARSIANRFKASNVKFAEKVTESETTDFKCYRGIYNIPFPLGFKPTFYKERLDEMQKVKKFQNIFVCSMADLFGDWVPDEWIQDVFKACEKAPQHRYIFLTKNPIQYFRFELRNELKPTNNIWLGVSLDSLKSKRTCINADIIAKMKSKGFKTFLSLEPLQDDLSKVLPFSVCCDWVIIGAETGSRKGKVVPNQKWIENIVNQCQAANVPVFMKDSLIPIIGEDNMVREFPWEVSNE